MSTDAYTIRFNHPLDREVARLVRSQVNRARRALKTPDDEGVHTARKALKRARAALRLVRGVIPRERYVALDEAIRGIGRHLAPVRDVSVALRLTEKLATEGAVDASISKPLLAYLDTEREAAWYILTNEVGVEPLRAELDGLRLDRSDLTGLDALGFHDGLAWTYARGRKRLADAVDHSHADARHAWRRQVKHLGYQLRLLAPTWPLVLLPAARAFNALAEALGDDHDWAEWTRIAKRSGLNPKALRTVKRLARTEQQPHQRAAWSLGARIYAEDAGAFAGRMTVYLAATLAEQYDAPIHPLDGLALPAPPNRPMLIPT